MKTLDALHNFQPPLWLLNGLLVAGCAVVIAAISAYFWLISLLDCSAVSR